MTSTTRAAPSDVSLPDSLWVEPWVDDVVDTVGHGPRSDYIELFYLPILGPSTTWLWRRLAAMLIADPDGGFTAGVEELGRLVGLAGIGKHAPVRRSIERLVLFHAARTWAPATPDTMSLQLRRALPTLPARQLHRLPESLQAAHEQWLRSEVVAS